ncbi:hypothetical protein TPHA_0M00680 [Tetrapisispora phaffii CBS 4417]|uniref:Uncharacterized protein n=1 Tax=Tetrapisispora phaffii (strain ATCC 24235 / CBS 4417 / NBRC 1672 / NRRL Y-8282 / UCD 70-5) TaxID=1071381 RepID=G8C0C8_TETPH|nr:hypothetical protein TPHA_0M00680 [Tetrapisispora phaffii CBS 4417]CCE65643.1 hypothetical protein TPHA_0M00680 [Tetrapisispora phaffii CBS 4417]
MHIYDTIGHCERRIRYCLNMAIRHIKRRYSESSAESSSDNSSDESNKKPDQSSNIDVKKNEEQELSGLNTKAIREDINYEQNNINGDSNDNINNPNISDNSNGSENYSSSSSSSESDTSSESDSELRLFRPTFIKKRSITTDDSKLRNKEVKSDSTYAKLIKRVEHNVLVSKKNEDSVKLMNSNYSTDKDLLRKIVELDDDDSKNADLEREMWMKRQETRKQKSRELLVQKQKELEENELQKMLNADKNIEDTTLETEVPNSELDRKAPKRSGRTKENMYMAKRASNIHFGEMEKLQEKSMNTNEQDSEYSLPI